MQLIVKGQQIDVGDALREHVRQSLTNVFGKYFGDAIDGTVTFSREAHLLRASLTVHVGRGITAESEATADQPYAAFDHRGGPAGQAPAPAQAPAARSPQAAGRNGARGAAGGSLCAGLDAGGRR